MRDAKFDLIGGQTVGIKTMAVTWGFGDLEELLLYSPDFICHSPLDILETLKIGLQIVNLFLITPS